MNKKLFGSLAVAMVAVMMLSAIVSPALAKKNKPKKADGLWCYIPAGLHAYEFNPVQPEPPAGAPVPYLPEQAFNAFWETSHWTGKILGDATDAGWGVFHNWNTPEAYPSLFEGVVTFEEVTVKGHQGALQLDVGGYRALGMVDWVGAWQVVPGSGTGELEGLEGYGTLRGPGFQPDNPTECGKIYYFIEELKGLD